MKINKFVAISVVLVFCFASSYLLSPRPKGCPNCWQKFKNSTISIILPFEKVDNKTYMISLCP